MEGFVAGKSDRPGLTSVGSKLHAPYVGAEPKTKKKERDFRIGPLDKWGMKRKSLGLKLRDVNYLARSTIGWIVSPSRPREKTPEGFTLLADDGWGKIYIRRPNCHTSKFICLYPLSGPVLASIYYMRGEIVPYPSPNLIEGTTTRERRYNFAAA